MNFIFAILMAMNTTWAVQQKLMNADFRTAAQLSAASLPLTNLLNTDKIYDITNARQLSASISAGIIGASGASMPSSVITATTYTLAASDTAVDFDTTNNAITATLPTAASARGKIIRLVKVNASTANFVTIAPSGSQTISGASKVVLSGLDSVELISDGSNWKITIWPSIVARYIDSSGTSIPATTNTLYKFPTVNTDPYGSYSASTGLYTCPFTSRYKVSAGAITASTTLGTTQAVALNLYKASTNVSQFAYTTGSGGATNFGVNGSDEILCAIGEQLSIYAFSNVALSFIAGSVQNHVTFERVGQ